MTTRMNFQTREPSGNAQQLFNLSNQIFRFCFFLLGNFQCSAWKPLGISNAISSSTSSLCLSSSRCTVSPVWELLSTSVSLLLWILFLHRFPSGVSLIMKIKLQRPLNPGNVFVLFSSSSHYQHSYIDGYNSEVRFPANYDFPPSGHRVSVPFSESWRAFRDCVGNFTPRNRSR